jgi:hypothetical protein
MDSWALVVGRVGWLGTSSGSSGMVWAQVVGAAGWLGTSSRRWIVGHK